MLIIPSAIKPKETDDQKRWTAQARRLRMLTGEFEEDIREDIQRLFAAEIAADIALAPDLSRNTFLLVHQQLSTSYEESPIITYTDEPEDDEDITKVNTSRLWPIQRENELRVRALNESVIKLDWNNEEDEVRYRIVDTDALVLVPDKDYPDKIAGVEWLRHRKDDMGKTAWTWEVWDIQDKANPQFRIEAINQSGKRIDATSVFAPELAGIYPYYDKQGAPILPFILYHAKVGSKLWDWKAGSELVFGTLRLCSLWSNWQDGFVNSAHPQRYALDADSQAGVTRRIGGVSVDVVPVDRKSILKFTSTGATGAQLSQFNPTMEPRSSAEALEVYERGLAIYAGLNPSDLQVTGAQSGYAIVVSRDGQRRKAKELQSSLVLADRALLACAARLANAYSNTQLPEVESEYIIEYRGDQETTEERKSKVETLEKELSLGLISKVDALRRLNPSLRSDEEAVDKLLDIQRAHSIIESNEAPDTSPNNDPPTEEVIDE